ncbi:hypothetical protein ACP4OV_011851 [Aristida adscensionis]
MEQSGGEKPSGEAAGEDRLSALPDDALVLILLRLGDTAAPRRTSVLSRRWRRVWTLLPRLRFRATGEPQLVLVAAALAAHEAAIRHLAVETLDAAAAPVSALLNAAAGRISGRLVFRNRVAGAWRRRNNAAAAAADDDDDDDGSDDDDEVVVVAGGGGAGAVELPCLENATAVSLDVGFLLGLAVPAAGVFARLTEISIARVRFHGPSDLGDAVSSPRCPSLEKLSILDTMGMADLTIRSDTLLKLVLEQVHELRRLAVAAPKLRELKLSRILVRDNQLSADISAPNLILLEWRIGYDPSSIQLGKMEQLQWLLPKHFRVYGAPDSRSNLDTLGLLKRFKVVDTLMVSLLYPEDLDESQYLMEEVTMLPHVTFLILKTVNYGHSFGASSFHVLRLCTGIRRLVLQLHTCSDLEAQECPLGCICGQSTDWKTEEISLTAFNQ